MGDTHKAGCTLERAFVIWQSIWRFDQQQNVEPEQDTRVVYLSCSVLWKWKLYFNENGLTESRYLFSWKGKWLVFDLGIRECGKLHPDD